MKSTVLVIVAVVMVLAGGVGYSLKQSKRSHALTVITASSGGSNDSGQLSVSGGAQAGASLAGQTGTGLLGATVDSGSSTSLQSNVGQQSPDTSSTPSDGPETFGQYDKYLNEQTALFGDLKVGSGAEAKAGSTVAMLYKGWLTNGQLFDQSHTDKDGKIQAFEFTIGSGSVVPGWDQGITGMKVGGSRRLIVPPAAGYGPAGKPPIIPANAVMIFEVQLVSVK